MQQLIELRSATNNLSVLLIAINKTVNDTIEVKANPSESTAIDTRLLEVLGDKLVMQLDLAGDALGTFTDKIGGLLLSDEEDSDI
jgi:hypothetical protein